MLVLFVSTVIISCGPGKIGGSITFWCMPNGPEKAHKAWLGKKAKEFEAVYGTKVNYEIVGWGQAFPKISTCVATGVGADVFQVGTTWNGSFAATKGLEAVDDVIDDMGGDDAFMKASLATAKYKGNYYGVPWFAETRCLIYNKTVFDKLGLKAPKTNDELIAVSKAIIKSEGKGKAIAIVGTGAWDLLHNFAVILWSNGGKILSDDQKSSEINSAIAVETMEWYVNLVREGYASKACAEYNTPQANAVFGAGNAAMAFMNTGDLSFIDTDFPKLKYGVIAPPKGKVKKAAFAGGSNIVVLKAGSNKAAAKAWTKFICGEENNVSYCKEITKMLPTYMAAYDDPYFEEDVRMKTFKDVFMYATSYPPLSVWGDVENGVASEFSNILSAYIDGKLKAGSVQTFLDKSKKKIDAALAKEK